MLAVAEDTVAKRDRLAQRRKALGLTQEDLAGLLHVERSTVFRWEHGECEPLPWFWPKLARALKVPTDRLGDLLDGGGPGESSRGTGSGRVGATTVVPRQLPTAVAGFTGRPPSLPR